jgi:Kef-type K+ transport system membrane component KefB
VSAFESPFAEVAALLLGAALIGGIAVWLRQPLIIAFIVVGVLEGPAFLGWVRRSCCSSWGSGWICA